MIIDHSMTILEWCQYSKTVDLLAAQPLSSRLLV